MSIPWKVSHRLNEIPIKIPAAFLVKIYKLILKLRWKYKGHKIVKTISKNSKAGQLILIPRFIIKLQESRLWDWHKDRHTDQWNKLQSPERSIHIWQINF